MKRPAGTAPKRSKRTPKVDPIEDLKARLEEVELDSTFNARTDPVSLDDLYTLLVDMIAGVKTHGPEQPEDFAKVKPETTWKRYLQMWLEQHQRLAQTTHKYSTDDDEVFYHADAVEAELERREKLAWRLWLCQKALATMNTPVTDGSLREHLQVFRGGAVTKRAA